MQTTISKNFSTINGLMVKESGVSVENRTLTSSHCQLLTFSTGFNPWHWWERTWKHHCTADVSVLSVGRIFKSASGKLALVKLWLLIILPCGWSVYEEVWLEVGLCLRCRIPYEFSSNGIWLWIYHSDMINIKILKTYGNLGTSYGNYFDFFRYIY